MAPKRNHSMSTKTQDSQPAPPAEARCSLAPCSAGWVRGEAPKDGTLYVALGRMVGSDEWGGHSTPFLSHVRWGGSGGWSGWVDERGMAISSDIDDRVYIDYWCALPNGEDDPRRSP